MYRDNVTFTRLDKLKNPFTWPTIDTTSDSVIAMYMYTICYLLLSWAQRNCIHLCTRWRLTAVGDRFSAVNLRANGRILRKYDFNKTPLKLPKWITFLFPTDINNWKQRRKIAKRGREYLGVMDVSWQCQMCNLLKTKITNKTVHYTYETFSLS
jgi:hypothetical protein